jgi:fumarate hydratase class II
MMDQGHAVLQNIRIGIDPADARHETDAMGDMPADELWGPQTQRSLQHVSIGHDLIPRAMIGAYAVLKRASAAAKHAGGGPNGQTCEPITRVCDEILAGERRDMFPLQVWMTGSGTRCNMNVNEVASDHCCQLAGTPLGSKAPVHRSLAIPTVLALIAFGRYGIGAQPAKARR